MKKIISCILFMLCITGIVALNAAAAGVSATVNGIPVPADGGSVTAPASPEASALTLLQKR